MARGRLVVAALAVALPITSGSASADDVLATLPPLQKTRLSAYAGHVVWSEPIAPGRNVLMRWRDGHVDRLPVAPRAVPFDVDLGPDARGRPVAVYSRCPGERENALPVGGCDVYRLSLIGGREHKLRRVSTSRASEYAPTIWRGNVAYASATSGTRTRLMLLRRGARRPVRVAGGSSVAAGTQVGPTDLTSNALVYKWIAGDASELWRVSLTGARRVLLATGFTQEGSADQPESPNATPDATIWVRVISTPCIETRIVADHQGKRRATAPMPRDIRALARDGRTLYAITSAPAPCSRPADVTLVKLSPPTFGPGIG